MIIKLYRASDPASGSGQQKGIGYADLPIQTLAIRQDYVVHREIRNGAPSPIINHGCELKVHYVLIGANKYVVEIKSRPMDEHPEVVILHNELVRFLPVGHQGESATVIQLIESEYIPVRGSDG